MKQLIRIVVVAALACGLPAAGARAVSLSHTSHDLLGEGIGLLGYDPVAYFPEGGSKPVKGHIMISEEYDGVTYRFASEEHRALFQKDPGHYVPAYGGWCTWAVAVLARHVDVDPESYVLRNGRLYVFYRDPQLDTRSKFLEDPEGMLAKAEANWPALSR